MELDYINNYYYTLCNGMEYIQYMVYNLVIRNQEINFNNDVLQRMVKKLTVLNDELVSENKTLKEKIEDMEIKKKEEEEARKKPLLPLPIPYL